MFKDIPESCIKEINNGCLILAITIVMFMLMSTFIWYIQYLSMTMAQYSATIICKCSAEKQLVRWKLNYDTPFSLEGITIILSSPNR